ncbi:hypothetical protein CR513_18751, partial [Mucuna pruriens]
MGLYFDSIILYNSFKCLMETWVDLDLSSSEKKDKETNIFLMDDTTSEDDEERHQLWYLDNDFSCHIMGERSMFQVLRIGKHPFPSIDNVLFFEGLKHNLTLYELWKGKQPNISYFHHFGCECFILNTKDSWRKFNPKSDKGTFLGYFDTSKAYI